MQRLEILLVGAIVAGMLVQIQTDPLAHHGREINVGRSATYLDGDLTHKATVVGGVSGS
jgi:hypothetical protein